MLHVAEAARVSVATVSAVINGTATVSRELTERIEQAIRDIGYKRNAIARSLKMGTTHTIGLTVPHIANPFFTDVVSVIQQAFDRAGYAVMLCCTDEHLDNQDAQIRLLLDRMVDGLIVARVGDSANFKKLVDGANVPVVLIDRVCEGVDTDAVVLDNRRAVFDAITYLTNLGHRRIGYISGSFAISPMPDRFAGYREALAGGRHRLRGPARAARQFPRGRRLQRRHAAAVAAAAPERDLLGQQPDGDRRHEGDPRPRPVLPRGCLGRLLRRFPLGGRVPAAAHHRARSRCRRSASRRPT